METSRWIGSFDATNSSRRSASILLDVHARIGDRMNTTTIARVKSRHSHTMDVSFWIHQPPTLSYLCVNCHKVDCESEDAGDFEADIVGAEGCFVLLRARFDSYGQDEYFMYKVGDDESGESASLHQVPLTPHGYRLPTLSEFGIVPRGDTGHYLLAAICLDLDPLYYRLYIYSSAGKRWTAIKLLNPCPEVNKVITSKVITLGKGVIGWVDFQHGMLVCDLHEEQPSARYIPLPEPLPENRDKLRRLLPGPFTRRFRDLTCINGRIKFIEMEHYVIEKPSDPSDRNALFDSDLIFARIFKNVDEKPKQLRPWNGWRIVMWSRTISCNCWHKGCILNVPDISVEESMYLLLPSGLRCENVFDKLLYSAFPTLSTDDNDILYLKSVSKFSDPDGWMVAVDLRRKRLKGLGAYSSAMHEPFVKAYCPYTFDSHLHIDPGRRDSACCKSIKVGCYINDPNNMPVRKKGEGNGNMCHVMAQLGKYANLEQKLLLGHPDITSNGLEAPKPCFNHWDGVSCPGSSQQQSASSTFAYGIHSDYCNCQRHALHHFQDLPVHATWQQQPPFPHLLTPCAVWHQQTPEEHRF